MLDSYKSVIPGEEYNIKLEDTKNVRIYVSYDTIKENDELKLYNKKIGKEENNAKVTIKGYMPIDSEIIVNEIEDKETVKNKIKEENKKNVNILRAFDIKIKCDEKEYEPYEFDKNVKVIIEDLENINKNTKIWHITDNENVEEVKYTNKLENKIEFETESFSTYVLGEEIEQEEQSTSWDGSIATAFAGGTGTINDPYQISNAYELAYLAEVVNSYKTDLTNGGFFTQKYYIQTQDIDLSNINWTPIGFYPSGFSLNYTFQGDYNGNGYQVKNIAIDISKIENFKRTYGLFGAVYSSNSSKRAMIYNLIVNNMNINVSISGTPSKDITIGGIIGHIGLNSSAINCLIKNSNITVQNTFILKSTGLLAIGGIVGDASATAGEDNASRVELKGDTRYKIDNCFSDVDITLNDSAWTRNGSTNIYYQFNIGGIIGRIRAENQFPQNCVYTGKITSVNAFIGPIYGCARFNTANTTNTVNYLPTYAGLNASNASIGDMTNGYFYKYSIVNDSLDKKENPIESTYNQDLNSIYVNGGITVYSLSSNVYMGVVQGVNRGEYISGLTDKVSMFNEYENIDTVYKRWYYDIENDTYTFTQQKNIDINLNEIEENKFQVEIQGDYQEEDITYNWYINDELQIESSNTMQLTESNINRKLKVVVYENGIIIGVKEIDIPKINVSIKLNKQGETIVAEILTESSFTINDFEFSWYKKLNDNFILIDEQNSNVYNGELLEDDIIKVVAKSKKISDFELETIYNNQLVIYVNYSTQTINGAGYQEGIDSNDGLTPETPVKTIEKAYELLDSSRTEKNNIIVIMGQYEGIIGKTNVYTKPATITGKLENMDYFGNLRIGTYNMLEANTIFRDIILNGHSDSNGNYIYCQTNDLTMGEGISVKNFAKISSTWGLVSTNYPAISIVGGYLNYNGTDILSERVSNIKIYSGEYARIIAGDRNENNNSGILGSASKPFNMKITVDIKDTSYCESYDGNIGLLVGGQADESCYINSQLNIKSGKIGRVIGANLGYFLRKSSIYPTDSFFGSITMNISGGEISDLFGGSLGRNGPSTYCYGKITINVTGGKIKSAIYGTGAGGVTGYSEQSTDKYKNYAYNTTMQDLDGNIYRLDKSKVQINISDNAYIQGNIYGGGFGESTFLTTTDSIAVDGGALYGDISISVTGGTIEGDIYGGGRGSSKYGIDRGNLAQIYGDIQVYISGNTIINGNVYGASQGISGYGDMAKVTGNVNLIIDSNNVEINGNVYGGGSIAKTIGDINQEIIAKTINNVYGGGDSGLVDGDIILSIKQVTIQENIFGGGNNETCNNVTINLGTKIKEESKIVIGGNVYGGNNNSEVIKEKSIENVNINVYTDIIASIYGGCNTKGLILNNVNISIYSSNIKGSVYGAGYGEESLVGQMDSNLSQIKIALDENSSIESGNIYGGGYGGKVNGSIKIYIQGKIGEVESTNIDGTVFGGGYGVNAIVNGNTEITFGTYENGTYSKNASAKGIFGGGYSGNINGKTKVNFLAGRVKYMYAGGYNGSVLGIEGTLINISQNGVDENDNSITTVANYVYGSSFGEGAEVAKTEINVSGANILNNIFGGGNGGKVTGSNGTGTILNINNVIVGESNLENGNIFGGGKGTTATVDGIIQLNVNNSTIYGNIFGGGDAGDVYGNTNVIVNGGTNVTKSIYGGGDAANVGTIEKNANTNLKVYNADIGKFEGTVLTGGEVFGGGDYGIVYGNTIAEVGNKNSEYETNVGLQFYSGGRGLPGTITVTGNSNGIIAGINTEVKSYGSIELGAVTGEVNIIFDTYRKSSSSNKYKNMAGINKATNMTLIDSDVYLTGGLKDITNLNVPIDSGIMISDDSEIYGDFTGGGTVYLQNEICLTIDGDITERSTTTTLILNPELLEEERCYVIRGNNLVPYIKVMGNDYTNGCAVVSGNTREYDIYSLNKDNNNNSIYNALSKNFRTTGDFDEEGEIYYNLNNENDTKKYYFDSQKSSYYIKSDNLEIRYYVDDTSDTSKNYVYDSNRKKYYYANNENCDSIYYIETTIKIQNYVTIVNNNVEDKVYQSDITNEDNAYVLKNGAFSSQMDTVYTMLKGEQDGTWQFLNSSDFLNLKRTIYIANDEEEFLLPIGTNITMMINGKKYTYRVNESYRNRGILE